MDAKKRRAAADALAESRTFTEAAQKIGVDRRTLYRWMREDETINTLATEAVELADMERHERSIEAEERAYSALWDIAESKEAPASDRIRALREIREMIDTGVGSRRLRQWGGQWRSLFDELENF